MSIARSVSALLVTGYLSGCATNPATGIAASGQPLGIKTEAEHVAWREQQKVGEIQFVDAAGNNAGSASAYQTRVVNAVKLHWWPTQGGTVIDDQDFFRIARDDRAVAEIEDYRTRAKWLNRVGFGMFALGAGGTPTPSAAIRNPGPRASSAARACSWPSPVPSGSITDTTGPAPATT